MNPAEVNTVGQIAGLAFSIAVVALMVLVVALFSPSARGRRRARRARARTHGPVLRGVAIPAQREPLPSRRSVGGGR